MVIRLLALFCGIVCLFVVGCGTVEHGDVDWENPEIINVNRMAGRCVRLPETDRASDVVAQGLEGPKLKENSGHQRLP